MTATATHSASSFVARYRGLKDLLPGARKSWLVALREDAALHFAARGFPTRRSEQWKYTDLSTLTETRFNEPLTMVEGAVTLPPIRAARRAVFVDGRSRPDLSTLAAPPFTIGGLAQRLAEAEGLLGALATPQHEPLTALNTMLFEDGLWLDIPPGTEGGEVELLSVAIDPGRAFAFHPRHVIRLQRGARLTLVETAFGRGQAFHNPVFEILVEEGACLRHIRLLRETATVFHLGTLYVQIAARATYDNVTLVAGPRLVRNEIHARLAGSAAVCHLNGVQLAGDGQHVDTTIDLTHAAPDGTSRQTYKTVLVGRSRGVFQGRIHVQREAQRTDGYQMNQALLLSAAAEIDSKPQLEIYADNVKCSHGATVGALDTEALFYLRSRGIPERAAKAMLIEAFIAEVIETAGAETLREILSETVREWWKQREVAA